MITLNQIKQTLNQFQPKKLPLQDEKPGAVLVPLFQRNGEIFILFTKRSEDLPTHKGQISFPGGKKEEQDHSLLATALRETNEEIGIPISEVEIFGELDQIKTVTSNFLLSAYVGQIKYPFRLTINTQEVQEIIEIPFEFFTIEENWQSKTFHLQEGPVETWFIRYQQHTVWGATAQLMKHFITLF